MDIAWEDARLFLAVAEAGSLSAAAKRLKIAQPTVSRRVAELEAELGESLFARSVGGATLTALGERLLEPARRMAEWATEFERAAEKSETALEGVVRITAPPGLAFEFCAPFAVVLRDRLPGVRLEVVSTVRYLDLTRRDADLALRIEKPTQRELTTLVGLELDALPFASREYVARFKAPPSLAEIDWIAWAPPLDALQPNPTLARMIPNFRPAFASDDFLVQLRAAETGLGAIFLGHFKHRFARENGLVPLRARDLGPVRSGLYLVSTKSALAIPRVRAVADLLSAELSPSKPARPAKRARRV
ncbi:MAG TPA: LysR family transcriptional regulator [Polyangiaceae bacterium]|jgi:DNA-binding transcriptional LysR family regulator|nr:LysR family transcriptional regulator [Polyangiaceae bacterium]